MNTHDPILGQKLWCESSCSSSILAKDEAHSFSVKDVVTTTGGVPPDGQRYIVIMVSRVVYIVTSTTNDLIASCMLIYT